MKKLISPVIVAIIFIISSCSHNNPGNSAGNWTFEGTSYTATSSGLSGASLSATNGAFNNPTTYGEIIVQFYGSTAPATGGLFHVVSGAPTGSSDVVLYTYTLGGSNKYTSTGTDSKTVNVTITGGKLTVTGSNIEMKNNTNSADSSALTLNISQI